jgi:hypothetical protein
LSDREFREGFLNAEPIREILAKAEVKREELKPECQIEKPETKKFCHEGGADDCVRKYEKELASIS